MQYIICIHALENIKKAGNILTLKNKIPLSDGSFTVLTSGIKVLFIAPIL